jgi:hypothetical protein
LEDLWWCFLLECDLDFPLLVDEPEVPLLSEPVADVPLLLCCARNSSARCSTAAALAGSVLLEMPLSEL